MTFITSIYTGQLQVPQAIFSFFQWLGYLNSLLNPVIYTIFSPDFRNAFKKMLIYKQSSFHTSRRSQYFRSTRSKFDVSNKLHASTVKVTSDRTLHDEQSIKRASKHSSKLKSAPSQQQQQQQERQSQDPPASKVDDVDTKQRDDNIVVDHSTDNNSPCLSVSLTISKREVTMVSANCINDNQADKNNDGHHVNQINSSTISMLQEETINIDSEGSSDSMESNRSQSPTPTSSMSAYL